MIVCILLPRFALTVAASDREALLREPCALAPELSIPTVVIPPEPGNFSAIGMLLADARIDTSKTFVGILNDKTVPAMTEVYRAMEKENGHRSRGTRVDSMHPATYET